MHAGELISEGELIVGSMVAGESYAGLGEQQAELHTGMMNLGEVDTEDHAFIAMEAVNRAEPGASELVVGREKIRCREWVQVQDEGPSKFVYIQNRVTLFAIQLHTALILPMLHCSTGESG